MKKSDYSFALLSTLLISTSALAENRAVELGISGIGPAVDAAAYQTVRQVIGHAVANGVIDKFVVYGYRVEGGFSACIEAAPQVQAEKLDAVVRQLNTIQPNSQTTAYSVKPAERCTTEPVACTLDAKQCPDGSYVSRVPPSCEFAACPATR
ncbi:MAG: hypothetical protein ACXWF8_01040 [Methylobacter sp.]